MTLRPLLVAALMTASAQAGSRTSASYSIPTDTVDSGGRSTTSASYTNDGSAAIIAGAPTTSASYTAKSGYVEQLIEVVGFALSAAASTVNEGATLQLAGWQVLQDASFLAVPATSVTWSVASGPLTGISASGLATAGSVYQNTGATAQGIYLGNTGSLALTVVNVNLDNFGAYAGDTLDDAWQVQYFGQPPNALAGPLLDPDGDGQTNRFEYTAGLVPTNAASRFTLTIAPVPAQPTQKRIIFSPLVLTGGRTYTVKFRPDLATGIWTTLTGTTQSDIGSERTVTDLNATGAKKFYQVEIVKP